MEKISRINKQYKNYNIETLLTPLKSKQNKYRENFMNSFFQDSNQAQNKTRPNIPINPKTKDSISDTKSFNHFIDRSKRYNINYKKNKNQRYANNFIPLSPLSGDKTKQRNNNNDKNKKYTILNPFKERTSSSTKSILVPSNENQISIVNLDTINKNRSNNISYINDLSDKKLKRNNTVYIKKHFSKDKKLVNKFNSGNYHHKSGLNLNNKNWNKDDYEPKPKRKNMLRYNSSNTMRKQSKTKPTQENNTTNDNNINPNVNIFNFDMQYNNSPNYYIKNSKMYNPYFNNYLPSTLNNNNEMNNFQNLITIRNKKYKNSFNDTIIKLDNEEEEEKMEKQLFHQSAIMIQSAFRGCIIRAQINNLLKAYKGIEYLDYFFRMKFWKYFRNILIYMKSNIINNDMDSKLSISSFSCISALLNTNKNFSGKLFNSKLLRQEIRENFSIINHISNNNNNNNNNINNKYLDTFKNINIIDNIKNKVLIWNKKKIYKNNTSSNIINQKLVDTNNCKNINNNKEKCLKMIVIKSINHSRLYLLKYFMKFYFNGILNKNENKIDEYSKKDFDKLKYVKLKNIFEKKEQKPKLILHNCFVKFYFKGLLKFMENKKAYLINKGRLNDISSIYPKNSNIKEKNLKLTLRKIIILKRIILRPRKLGNEEIRKYFYKFHLYGIINFMKKELNKRIISKKLIIIEKEKKIEDDINDKNKDKEMKNLRIKILKRAICNKDRIHKSICKNIFDKWDLKTRIFSIIAIDKEKKKKRRIKKRNNKKLGSNNINNQNNNANINLLNNNKNNISQKISNVFVNSNSGNNLSYNKKGINQNNFIVEHRESVIFSNNIKINDYFKIDKFIGKIYSILTYKFQFFSLIKNKCKKKNGENNDEKLKSDDIDFFEDSSEQSED